MKATITFHRRNNNTSEPLETLRVEKKIAGPRGTTPTDPLVMATMGRSKIGATKAIIQSLANLKKGHNLGNNVLRASNKSSTT